MQIRYGKLEEPQNPLLRYISDPEQELKMMLDGYEELERSIGYKFHDISYLLQAFTHASYQPNRLTDCYQRLEFLGDAVLGSKNKLNEFYCPITFNNGKFNIGICNFRLFNNKTFVRRCSTTFSRCFNRFTICFS